MDDGTASQPTSHKTTFNLTFISRETPIPPRAPDSQRHYRSRVPYLRGGIVAPREPGETPPGNTLRAFPRREACRFGRASSGGEPEGQQRRRASRRRSQREHRSSLVASEKRCQAQPHGGGSGGHARPSSLYLVDLVWSRPSMMLALRRTRVPDPPQIRRSFPLSNRRARPLTSPSPSSSALAPQGTQGGGLEFMSFDLPTLVTPTTPRTAAAARRAARRAGGRVRLVGWRRRRLGRRRGGAGFGGGGGGMGFGDTGATVETRLLWRSSASIPRRSFGERRCSPRASPRGCGRRRPR